MTIRDIAKLAKVSVSTVSRVINNQNVRMKTKQEVLKVIEKYDFYPNTYAQYLGRRNNAKIIKKTGTVSKETAKKP